MKQVCNLYQQGRCEKGKKCKYMHMEEKVEKPINQEPKKEKIQMVGPKVHHIKIFKWADLSKLADSQEIFRYNQEILGGDFFKIAKEIKNDMEKDFLQFFRKFQQSIKFLPQPQSKLLDYLRNQGEFQVIFRFVPSIDRKELAFKEQVKERYFEILIQIDKNYPKSSVIILNQSLSEQFKEILQNRISDQISEKKGLFQGLRYIETHFDEIVLGL
ncbi:unnamed protein product (macronuclear) [Paramecium tetraurelia]|uniref:C3H1-type domain-containing protein n=1 Tax=Paramecium tetraurelia TaxID=5888 RepID=A0DX36_PARTE|nr:uncharacterized protein GSPATT00021235001 [Paramecium tetraurelia]CAK87603.1 unnamed protein product [Paramecium tetraurelia]|eukprot:XP_001455000.1 hypothetical protein (macronuclear) [Paramecium tetraurelia strain d4-2]